MIKIMSVSDIKVVSPHKITKQTLQKAKNIITRFGQFKPLLVKQEGFGEYTLISGQTVLAACKELGIENVLCYMFSDKTTDDDIQTLRLIDNTPRLLDVIKTAKVLEAMSCPKAVDRIANVLPFSRKELKNFVDLKNFDWESYDNDESHYVQTGLFD